MKVLCYSSFTFSYLNRARVLFQTLRRFHPDWELVALITDRPPQGFAFDPAAEPFDRVVWAEDLGIPDFQGWLFKHDVVEVCTAVKGPFLHQACGSGADAVIYLDPDTALFGSLAPLEAWLEDHDILLTPHLVDPNDTAEAIRDNDLSASRTGIFNLGFVAVRTKGEGARFAKWWNERLLDWCYDDMPNGIFVDQRWCDHVPALFDRVKVVRDPGYNVASWNLSTRTVAVQKDGQVTVNGQPLRFWHFTKLGPMGDAMTKKYGGRNFPVYEIWSWYKRQVTQATDAAIPERWWAYGAYSDGAPIEKAHRVLYRERPDLQAAFPDPFRATEGGYRQWLEREGL
jgi:sulfur carrier protein ThiS